MRTCQGAAMTGQPCEGTGEEVRRCSEQRCPGECAQSVPGRYAGPSKKKDEKYCR